MDTFINRSGYRGHFLHQNCYDIKPSNKNSIADCFIYPHGFEFLEKWPKLSISISAEKLEVAMSLALNLF